ncbi:MAG: circadian clock KaiB family protein [Anaerolineae bacterium]|nr:circadian clock KaiB family protein [Anaerolineae bacterium]
MNIPYVLKLYVVGQTIRSRQAVASMRRICREKLGEQCECIIIDVLEQPELAEADKIIATPTLIKVSPPPVRRLLGDLSNLDRVIEALGLQFDLVMNTRDGGEQ